MSLNLWISLKNNYNFVCGKFRFYSINKRMVSMKKKINKIDRMLELPQEVYTNVPKVIITGFDEMIIENFKGILEYEEFFVQVNTYLGIVNINGYGLTLENMTDDDIKVKGKIESIEIDRNVDES